MGKPQFKSPDPHKNGEDVAGRCQQETDELRKKSYWSIRKSDERIAKTNDTIDRSKQRLRAAGISPKEPKPEPQPDPFLAWGELLINGSGTPKRRAGERLIHPNGHPKRRSGD